MYLSINRNNLLQVTASKELPPSVFLRFVKGKRTERGRLTYDQNDFIAFKMSLFDFGAFAFALEAAGRFEDLFSYIYETLGSDGMIKSIFFTLGKNVFYLNAQRGGDLIGITLTRFEILSVALQVKTITEELVRAQSRF